jgi:excisionase family DNA binding protein
MANTPKRLLLPEELAEQVQIPVRTLYAWRLKGEGPRAIRVGKHIRFRQSDVDEWLESRADPDRVA